MAEFRDAYRLASQQRLADTIGLLRVVAQDALAALRTALQSENDHVKVRTAVALLELAVKVEVDELAERVAALDTGKVVLQLCGTGDDAAKARNAAISSVQGERAARLGADAPRVETPAGGRSAQAAA